MKLESYRRFNKEILLMFRYILVVSTGYILLISICPVLKPIKMKSIASSAIYICIYLQIYLEITLGCKNMVAFYSAIQKFQ